MKKITYIIPLLCISWNISAFEIDSCEYLPDSICNPGRYETMKDATTDVKAKYHVVFRESVDSDKQKNWKQGYLGVVELWVNGELDSSFAASTLPNNIKRNAADHVYSVLLSTCHHDRYYTWKRGLRVDGVRQALRLKFKTPTVNIASIRDVQTPKYLAKASHLTFAENILVHKGWKKSWRGSHGCLTVDPDVSSSFFSKIPMGTVGTMEVIRKVRRLPLPSGEFCY